MILFQKHAYNQDLVIAVQVKGKSPFASTFLLVIVCKPGVFKGAPTSLVHDFKAQATYSLNQPALTGTNEARRTGIVGTC